MQTTDDGEYIPTKELNYNFKIPKRKHEEIYDSTTSTLHLPSQSIVLENSYYNQATYPSLVPFVPEQPPPPGITLPKEPEAPAVPVLPFPCVNPAQQFILEKIQKCEFEKPKTYQNHILRDTIPDCFDETLPRDLTSQFQPLYCKLCSVQLSSNIVAKMHYKSKNHEKKVRKYLVEYAHRTGEPLHKRAKYGQPNGPKSPNIDSELIRNDDSNPLYFYCDVCDLPLTGKLHAESHYLGKNHRKAISGQKKPAGKGHFNEAGKWVRDGVKRRADWVDPSCLPSDSFGASFHIQQGPTVAGFRCFICNITTTCHEQLEAHYLGQKHRKKMKQQGVDANAFVANGFSVEEVTTTPSVVVDVNLDISVYRTPSGQFYCQVCNSTNNSEAQFRQHLQSKGHCKLILAKK